MKRNGLRWYQVIYRLLYRVGLVFWQRSAPPSELVALVEGPSALPPGRALELGCGTGTDTAGENTSGYSRFANICDRYNRNAKTYEAKG